MADILAAPNNQIHECEESVQRRSVRFSTDASEQASDDGTTHIGSQSLTPSVIVTGNRVVSLTDRRTTFSQREDEVETFTGREDPSSYAKPLVHRYVPYESKNAIDVVHQWECVVTNLHDNGKVIEVSLHDLRDDQRPVESGEFSINEIPPSDREHIKPGAVLYWCVGYENRRGTHWRVSEIRRKRMPRLTRQRERIVSERATDLSNEFGITAD